MRRGSAWSRWRILSSGFDCTINVYIIYSIYDMLIEVYSLCLENRRNSGYIPFFRKNLGPKL